MPGPVPPSHSWSLAELRQLPGVRREARALLRATSAAGEAGSEAVERAVLVLDELASNALRHGRAPAGLQWSDQGATWLVVATDSAPDQLPTPAHGRPAGAGGYGLHVITDLAVRRGLVVGAAVKRVWALLPKT